MAKTGTYAIWIGTNNNGSPLIGAAACDAYGDRFEKIFGSQFPHRVTARKEDGEVVICTPTEAKQQGYDVLRYFG